MMKMASYHPTESQTAPFSQVEAHNLHRGIQRPHDCKDFS
jgi:hypothetical protein